MPSELLPHVAGALDLARRGIRVFPVVLVRGRSQPAKKDPWRIATTDEARILEWGQEYGLFGVDCGGSDLCVLDVDVKAGKPGLASLAELEKEHGALPESWLEVETPSGGKHLYFRGATRSRNGFRPGLDVKSIGGFVVAPGSAKPGGQYRILREGSQRETPEWIQGALKAKPADPARTGPVEVALDLPEAVAAAVQEAQWHPEAVEGQGGDQQTLRLALRLKDLGVSQAKALEILLEHYNPRCSPPWSVEDLRAKLRNAWVYGRNAVGVDSPALAFPRVSLDSLASAARKATEIDVAAIPPRRWLIRGLLCRGYVSGLIGPPGVGKSTIAGLQALAVASDGEVQSGYGDFVEGGAVWLHNSEDSASDMDLRQAAFFIGLGYPASNLRHQIYRTSREHPIKIGASGNRGTPIIDRVAIEAAKEFIRTRGISLWILDPLVGMHHFDENSNRDMEALLDAIREVAADTLCSVLLSHHTRKFAQGRGESADASDARGASALTGALRIQVATREMTEAEAKRFGIDPRRRRWYLRVDDTKNNLCAPVEKAVWYEKRGVCLPGHDDEELGYCVPADPEVFDQERLEAARSFVAEVNRVFGEKAVYEVQDLKFILERTEGKTTTQGAKRTASGMFREPVEAWGSVYKWEGRGLSRTPLRTDDLLA